MSRCGLIFSLAATMTMMAACATTGAKSLLGAHQPAKRIPSTASERVAAMQAADPVAESEVAEGRFATEAARAREEERKRLERERRERAAVVEKREVPPPNP